MRDLLRFEIWQVFLFSKIFVMCVNESIIALKLARGWRIALEAKFGKRGVNFIMVHFRFVFYEEYNFYIPPPPNFQFCYFHIDE